MSEVSTIVSAQTHIVGKLQGDEALVVQGRVDGSIVLGQTLTVEPSGIVVAEVQADSAIVRGIVVGNITATDLIQIEPKGRVVGDLSAARVVLADGASFRGNVAMAGVEAPRAQDGKPLGSSRSASAPSAAASRPSGSAIKTVAKRETTRELVRRTPGNGVGKSSVAASAQFAPPSFQTAAGKKVRARHR